MFDPDDEWDEACRHCSFWADSFNPNVVHLSARDVTMVAVSRAPAREDRALPARGWVGRSRGCRPTAATSTTTSASRSRPRTAIEPVYNFGTLAPGLPTARASACSSRTTRRDLPHLLDVRARHRHAQHRVQLPRSRPTRTRRARQQPPVLGSPPRRVRTRKIGIPPRKMGSAPDARADGGAYRPRHAPGHPYGARPPAAVRPAERGRGEPSGCAHPWGRARAAASACTSRAALRPLHAARVVPGVRGRIVRCPT